MPIAMYYEGTNVYRLEIRGILRKSDLDGCQEALASQMDHLGPVRLLIVLEAFKGWEPQDDWRDLTFYVNRGDSIDRIAIVADERWRDGTLMFSAADLRKGAVEFFNEQALPDARAWLAA